MTNYPTVKCSDSYRIQTYNLLIRSQMLYSVELRSHLVSQVLFSLKADAKIHTFSECTKYFFIFLPSGQFIALNHCQLRKQLFSHFRTFAGSHL